MSLVHFHTSNISIDKNVLNVSLHKLIDYVLRCKLAIIPFVSFHPPSPTTPTLYSKPNFTPTLSWFHDQLFTTHLTSHPPFPYFYFMTNSLQPTWLPTHPLLISISWPTLYITPDFPPTLSLILFHDQLFTIHLTSHPPFPYFYLMTNSLQPT